MDFLFLSFILHRKSNLFSSIDVTFYYLNKNFDFSLEKKKTKFHEWGDKVKKKLIAYGPSVWKLVCDGYCKDSPSVQERQWNAKEKCVMYKNLHNKDFDTIIDLNFSK